MAQIFHEPHLPQEGPQNSRIAVSAGKPNPIESITRSRYCERNSGFRDGTREASATVAGQDSRIPGGMILVAAIAWTFSEQAFYRWKRKYAGFGVAEF
jgi:hypothetical protein